MKKQTREELVEEINSYPGQKVYNRVKREILIEILEYRKMKAEEDVMQAVSAIRDREYVNVLATKPPFPWIKVSATIALITLAAVIYLT